ncbi:cytochrome c oxidase subunit II [Aquibaculum arenosum]|uniref:Cytochrome aa3 subunit 2 n=1 Tax=Aquibaculum arenosum TaxID=3032591 RepID=A0ABT5YPY0_9PROT|nr:cytochrome c oxidase subunit II [Fodinicurvata sp. CAU 1616]MDF2096937.1 cytochrome c oxidase subunit II [Fodinicurvata sp. CAU 1616]
MSALDPAGPAADALAGVWWVMLGGSFLILGAVVALALYAIYGRGARRSGITPRLLIVGGGLVFTPAVLAALLIWGIGAGHALLPLPGEREVYRIEVRAHQWWWEVTYPDAEDGPLHAANEIHIPAGRPVDITVRAEDVIHSFWVPRLGGKIDALPGHTNVIRLEAPAAGVYRGQCAEFCGAQHSRMALLIEAHETEALEERLALLSPTRESDSAEAPGAAAFQEHCAVCHSLDPRTRGATPAPNLADLPHRATLGAGTLPNAEGALLRWLRDHQDLKPGNRMPRHDHLDPETLEAIANHLEGPR